MGAPLDGRHPSHAEPARGAQGAPFRDQAAQRARGGQPQREGADVPRARQPTGHPGEGNADAGGRNGRHRLRAGRVRGRRAGGGAGAGGGWNG